MLDFDRNGGIGPLHVRGGAEHSIDIGSITPGAGQRIARRSNAHFGGNRKLVVRPFAPARGHDCRVEQWRLGDYMARLDAAGLLDEFDRTGLQGLDRAAGDRRRMFGIEALDIGVEGENQLCVRDALGRGVETSGGNDRSDFNHGRSV